MFEPATNNGLADYIARKERERRGIEFWSALDKEVEEMRLNRIRKELLGLYSDNPKPKDYDLSPPKVKRHFRPKNTVVNKHILTPGFVKSGSMQIIKHDDAGNSFVDHSYKSKISDKKKQSVARLQKNTSKCFYCTVNDGNTIDHIIATSVGGSKGGAYNKVYSCAQCNSTKGNFSLEIFLEIMIDVRMLSKRRFGTYTESRRMVVIENIKRLIVYRDGHVKLRRFSKKVI